MQRKQQIDALMSELGPLLDPLAITTGDDDCVWGIKIDEDILVLADLDDPRDALVLSCEVGTPGGDRPKLYELLLRYNFHWDQTGGSRLALDGEAGNVVLISEVPVAGLEVSRLHGVVQNFVKAARAWRAIVTRAAAPGTGDPGGQFGQSEMIRVRPDRDKREATDARRQDGY